MSKVQATRSLLARIALVGLLLGLVGTGTVGCAGAYHSGHYGAYYGGHYGGHYSYPHLG